MKPGDIVGVRGSGSTKDIILSGPHTISRRPTNPHDQHMWQFVHGNGSVAEYLLFPWIQGLQLGEAVPTQRSLQNIVRNKTRNQVVRNIWERRTNTSSNPGTGPLHMIMTFAGKTRKAEQQNNRT